MTPKLYRIFNVAKRLSQKSNHPSHKLGCVIFNKKILIGFGYNQVKTHPKSKTNYSNIHAEFHSILGVNPSDLRNASAFVYRETVKGTIGMAKPCPICKKLLFGAGIKEVYYTTQNGSIDKITQE